MKSHSLGADGWDPTMVRTVNRQFLFCPSILISAMYCTGTIFESLGCLAIYNRQAQDTAFLTIESGVSQKVPEFLCT